jgi:hypothetical protein
MNNKMEQAIDRLKDEIKVVETCLANTSDHLTSAIGESVEGLETRWKNALAKCEAKREQAEEAGQRLGQFLEEKKDELISKYEDWKTDREIEKLEKLADKQEQQAVDAIVVAACALLKAEVAIVEALKARKIAVEVAG